MLRSLVEVDRLTDEQKQHIDTLQEEIDSIWSRRGNYQLDPDAWENMPLFMENITEEDIEKNANCAALSSIVFDEVSPDEVMENRKEHGDRALRMALNPAQERRENLARAACYGYTEALQAKGKNMKLCAIIYSNRSLAQFIVGNYGHGLEDAQRAIILDPDYAKAYYRAAKCAHRLRKYDDALNMLSRGKQVLLPLNAEALGEFEGLEKLCRADNAAAVAKESMRKRETRVAAAKVSNLARAITSAGIKLANTPEVTSEQMGLYGNPRPYFDLDGLLHVPVLFMYDEYQQTDIMHDVACDVCAAEMLSELMPFPWDTHGRYRHLSDVVVCFKIDDGVKMVAYYEIDQSWPLMEVFRCENYYMPPFLPVLHILCKSSELLQTYKIHRV